MKHMLSNGTWASDIKDFEDVMNYNDFKALNDIVNTPDENVVNWEQAYKREELYSDGLFQRNTNAYYEIDELITYILETKRMNKAKILEKLQNIQNTLQNY